MTRRSEVGPQRNIADTIEYEDGSRMHVLVCGHMIQVPQSGRLGVWKFRYCILCKEAKSDQSLTAKLLKANLRIESLEFALRSTLSNFYTGHVQHGMYGSTYGGSIGLDTWKRMNAILGGASHVRLGDGNDPGVSGSSQQSSEADAPSRDTDVSH